MAKLADPLKKLTDDELLDELRDLAADLTAINLDRDRAYERRRTLWAEGRRRGVMGQALAAASDVAPSVISDAFPKNGA